MTRRLGYLTAGGLLGDLSESFWASRRHYVYREITVPQQKSKIAALKSWYTKPGEDSPDEPIVAGYHDLFYCGDSAQSNISDWRRDTLPLPEDPRFVRDVDGKVIPRFGGKGLFVHTVNSGIMRNMTAAIVEKSRELAIHIRLDNESPTLGWDFTGYYPGGVVKPHSEIMWNNKRFVKNSAKQDFIASDGTSFNALYRRAADDHLNWLRGYAQGPDLIIIANSGVKWLDGAVLALSGKNGNRGGRMQERNITPGTFNAEPWNVDPRENTWPLALTYPDTYDSVVSMMNNKTLPPNVVVVETADMKGRIIAQPAIT